MRDSAAERGVKAGVCGWAGGHCEGGSSSAAGGGWVRAELSVERSSEAGRGCVRAAPSVGKSSCSSDADALGGVEEAGPAEGEDDIEWFGGALHLFKALELFASP